MTWKECLAAYGLVPSDPHLPAIRALLREEMAREEVGADREEDLAYLCAVQLFSRAQIEDVLLIWDAKQTSFDLSLVMDVELLCGAGFAATRLALQARQEPSARDALAYIERCAATHFEDFDPARHLDAYRRYFGVATA